MSREARNLVRERQLAADRARRFWDGLDSSARGELGDQLVLGTLDWRDWLDRKPPAGFWAAVDALRIHWEMMS